MENGQLCDGNGILQLESLNQLIQEFKNQFIVAEKLNNDKDRKETTPNNQ